MKTQLPRLIRRHIPTGIDTEAKWTGYQHWMLSDPDGHPECALMKVCASLVAKWNKEQPDTWFYWLEERK
jgi:hypothetical protein